ncbi:MAG TPA: dihydroorotase [Dehalococcoidia bacterium]|nr:dihydroorotase [Dehalococcoidia bacterium]
MTEALLIRGRLFDPGQGLDRVGDLLIEGGKIAWLGEPGLAPKPDVPVLEAQRLIVCPGFIDLHCHLREPGQEDKETIASGTQAAARGGFTTVCAMPNTQPPLDSGAAVDYVLKRATQEGAVRVLPIGCITRGRKGEELAELGELAQAGAVAFSDDGNSVADPRLLRNALEYSRSFGLPVIEHCEDASLSKDGVMNEGWTSARLGLRGIPPAAEETVVARDIALAELTGARLHLAHLTTAGSVELVRRAKEKGLPITAEVTPHHLTLTEERVMGAEWGWLGRVPPRHQPLNSCAYDTSAKVNPPLRTPADVLALNRGLQDGTIDAIATDHAPHRLVDKLCEFDLAAFGISGLETALAALLALVHIGELKLETLIEALTYGPARILGRDTQTGLREGAPADITIFDPEAQWVVDPQAFASKGKNTPLAGYTLRGKVMATIVDGRLVYKDDSL